MNRVAQKSRTHKLMMTPYEKLKSLPQAAQFLNPGITFAHLDTLAASISDNEAAEKLNEARTRLFKLIGQSNAAA
jgi:hypothetical protein